MRFQTFVERTEVNMCIIMIFGLFVRFTQQLKPVWRMVMLESLRL